MRYREFGTTGLRVSSIGVGTWGAGGRGWGGSDRDACVKALRAMFDEGVNLIDTAPAYNRGRAEEITGEAVRGIRDQVIITTKCGMNIDKPGWAVKTATREEVIRGCEGSLRRMGLDYVDVLLLHWPDEKTPLRESVEAMAELKKQGKVRFIGVSNLDAKTMEEVRGYADVAVTQLPLSMVDRKADEWLKWANQNGMATMTYGSLGGGILTGAIRKLVTFDEDDVRGRFYPFFREPEFSKVMELVGSMDKIAARRGVPVSQIATNWVVQKNYVDTALIGVRTVEHAKDNGAAMRWELDDAEIAFLDAEIDRLLR